MSSSSTPTTILECVAELETRATFLHGLIVATGIEMMELEASAGSPLWMRALELIPASSSDDFKDFHRIKINNQAQSFISKARSGRYAQVLEICTVLATLHRCINHMRSMNFVATPEVAEACRITTKRLLETTKHFDMAWFGIPKMDILWHNNMFWVTPMWTY